MARGIAEKDLSELTVVVLRQAFALFQIQEVPELAHRFLRHKMDEEQMSGSVRDLLLFP